MSDPHDDWSQSIVIAGELVAMFLNMGEWGYFHRIEPAWTKMQHRVEFENRMKRLVGLQRRPYGAISIPWGTPAP